MSPCPFQSLLAEFLQIVTPVFDPTPPVWAHPCRLPSDKLALAQVEFPNLQKPGIICLSLSEWASPLHMAPKANGESCPCCNYHRLNLALVPDWYPIPHILDFSARLAGSNILSKIDLVCGYHQIPIHPSDVSKTAIMTPFSCWEFLRMIFGSQNAGQMFQYRISGILQELPFIFVHLDDILVASSCHSDHLDHLQQVFKRLQSNGLIICPDKLFFGKPSLGHEVDSSGIRLLSSKVKAISDFPRPSTSKQFSFSQFLSLIIYFHKFLPIAASLLEPLHTEVYHKHPSEEIVWSESVSLLSSRLPKPTSPVPSP